jgi:hypothetical protein
MALYNVVVTNFLKQYRQSHTSPHNMPIRRNATLPVTLSRTLLHLLLYKACSASTTLHCYAHHSTLDSAAHTDAHITRRTLPQCRTHILHYMSPSQVAAIIAASCRTHILPHCIIVTQPATLQPQPRPHTATLSLCQPHCTVTLPTTLHCRTHVLPHYHTLTLHHPHCSSNCRINIIKRCHIVPLSLCQRHCYNHNRTHTLSSHPCAHSAARTRPAPEINSHPANVVLWFAQCSKGAAPACKDRQDVGSWSRQQQQQ